MDCSLCKKQGKSCQGRFVRPLSRGKLPHQEYNCIVYVIKNTIVLCLPLPAVYVIKNTIVLSLFHLLWLMVEDEIGFCIVLEVCSKIVEWINLFEAIKYVCFM
ncbi:hypothetical protein Sjap_011038 [Stephania japonica]|uniref:Uncharacterized protein n=1 Tax=Stephania japonica TaxID=461633 RepID=A0AAP0JAI5_9MAGN